MTPDLSGVWERVLQLAWISFVAGTTPVGAVVVDPSGDIVAEGRGRRWEASGPPGELWGCDIAHAELNALSHLPIGTPADDHLLVTSLEPCVMCHGASIQARIRTICFAAPDPYAGTASLSVDTTQARRRPVRVLGPLGNELGALATLLHVVWLDSVGTAGRVVAAHRGSMPRFTGYALEAAGEVIAAGAADDYDRALALATAAPFDELV